MNTTPTKVKISVLQFFMVVIATTTAFGHFVFVHLAITYSGRDAWMSLVIGCILGGLISYVQLKLAVSDSDASIAASTVKTLGKWIGGLVVLVYVVFFLLIIAITVKILLDFLTIIYPTTPPGVFILAVLSISAWVSYKGVEVLTRTMEFILPFLILLGLSASLLTMQDKDFTQLFPILHNSWTSIWSGALVFTAMFSEMVVFRTITNHVNQPAKLPRYSLLVTGILFVMFLAPSTGPIMVFGEKVARSLAFPTYTEIQYIHIQNVFERFDIIGILLWANGSFFRVAAYLFAASKSVAELADVPENAFVIPLTVLAAAASLSIIQSSREEVYVFLGTKFIYIAIGVGVGLPVLTGLVAMMKKKLKRTANPKGAS